LIYEVTLDSSLIFIHPLSDFYLRAVGRKVLWSSACVCLCALPARRFVSRSDTAVYINIFDSRISEKVVKKIDEASNII